MDNLNHIFIVCLINNGGFLFVYAISTISTLNYLKSNQGKLKGGYCILLVLLEVICATLVILSALPEELTKNGWIL